MNCEQCKECEYQKPCNENSWAIEYNVLDERCMTFKKCGE